MTPRPRSRCVGNCIAVACASSSIVLPCRACGVERTEWWSAKLAGNTARDRDTDARLEEAGWIVVRVWEHEDPADAADRVQNALTPPS